LEIKSSITRGHVATEKSYKHIGVKYRGENSPQTDLFDL